MLFCIQRKYITLLDHMINDMTNSWLVFIAVQNFQHFQNFSR